MERVLIKPIGSTLSVQNVLMPEVWSPCFTWTFSNLWVQDLLLEVWCPQVCSSIQPILGCVVHAKEFWVFPAEFIWDMLLPLYIYHFSQVTHHMDVKLLGIRFVYRPSSLYKMVERTMARYTSHLVFIERSFFRQTRFFSPPKALKTFDILVTSSVSSLLLLATVEPKYLDLFTLVSI